MLNPYSIAFFRMGPVKSAAAAVRRSAVEGVGGGTDALEEPAGVFERQRASSHGRKETVERAQDGVSIGEGSETDGRGAQRTFAAPRTQVELLVMVAAGASGEWKRAAWRSIVLERGAEPGFHSILLCEGGVYPTS